MKKLVLLIGLIAPIGAFSQATIYINSTAGNVYIVEKSTPTSQVYLDVNNPSPTAFAKNGSHNGWIISEAENSMVKWDISNSPNTPLPVAYTVPFGGSPLVGVPMTWAHATPYYLPVTLNIGTAGSAGGSIVFSTWKVDPDNGTGGDALNYQLPTYQIYPDLNPSDVTNMNPAYANGSPTASDDSYNVVDRFWVVDAKSAQNPNPYVTAPTPGGLPPQSGIQFSYVSSGTSSEVGPRNNTLLPQNLVAQRFDDNLSTWGDFMGPAGTYITLSATVTNISSGLVTPSNFYRSWTLSNQFAPLPIVLKPGDPIVECVSGSAVVSWTSESEINNKFYTITKSSDGTHWVTVGTVATEAPGGNSSLALNYSFTDNTPYPGVSYYMLAQTDNDGNSNSFAPVQFNGCGTVPATTTIAAYNAGPFIDVQINAVENGEYVISLVNMLGQTITSTTKSVAVGANEYRLNNTVAAGIYLLNVKSNQTSYTQKLVLGVR